jgi:ketosteroid isomerase-like protein
MENLMSAEKNVQIVKDFFAAIRNHDKQAQQALCDENIEWIVPGKDWPLAGTRRGLAGMEDHFRIHSETMETSVLKVHEFVAQGDRVIVIGFASGIMKATNKKWDDDWVFVITVQDGKLKSVREYVDTQALAQAAEVA